MPTIRVTVPAGARSADEKARIADRLTSGLAEVAAGAGKSDLRQSVHVQFSEAATGGHATGGRIIG